MYKYILFEDIKPSIFNPIKFKTLDDLIHYLKINNQNLSEFNFNIIKLKGDKQNV